MLSANAAVECWRTYSVALDLCLLPAFWGHQKEVDTFFLFPLFTGVETSCAYLKRFIYFLRTHLSIITGRELLILYEYSQCSGLRSLHRLNLSSEHTTEVLHMHVFSPPRSFPLLHLPVVQMRGSTTCGCSWNWKLMCIPLFTLPQKPHLTSDKPLFYLLMPHFPMHKMEMHNVFGDIHAVLQQWICVNS